MSEVWRKIPLSRSALPPYGSTISPVRQSQSIEFIVKSRRAHAASTDRNGSHSTSKARCPSPVLRSVRGTLTSMQKPLRIQTPKLLPTISKRKRRERVFSTIAGVSP